jgi:hypothetical protein
MPTNEEVKEIWSVTATAFNLFQTRIVFLFVDGNRELSTVSFARP